MSGRHHLRCWADGFDVSESASPPLQPGFESALMWSTGERRVLAKLAPNGWVPGRGQVFLPSSRSFRDANCVLLWVTLRRFRSLDFRAPTQKVAPFEPQPRRMSISSHRVASRDERGRPGMMPDRRRDYGRAMSASAGPLIRAAVLTNYVEVMQHLVPDPHKLVRKSGLDKSLLDNPDRLVPLHAVVRLLESSARASDCPTLGLQMAETRQLEHLGAISLLLAHQRTVRNALGTAIEYRHLVNEAVAIELEEIGEAVIVHEEVVTDAPMPAGQATDLALGTLHRMCAALFGIGWNLQSVHFTHEAPPDLRVHRRVFGGSARLEFGSNFNGFVCSSADLEHENPSANATMGRYARQFVDSLPPANERSLVRDVRTMVYLLTPSGHATIEHVAAALGLTVRTLQRQLAEADMSFTDVVDSVRRDLAVRYLWRRSGLPDNPGRRAARRTQRQALLRAGSQPQFGMAPIRWRARHQHAADRG